MIMKSRLHLPDELLALVNDLDAHGIRAIVVGGYVRDALLGRACKDIDIECYGAASLDALAAVLGSYGTLSQVGKSFDPLSGEILDPYYGQKDLRLRRLRCVDAATFVDDPLRLLRAAQFCARFSLTPDKELIALSHQMMHDGLLQELPQERIFEEMKKLLLKADTPSRGLRTMKMMGIIPFFPELQVILEAGNPPWKHTLQTLDAMAALRSFVNEAPLVLMLTALCIDMQPTGETTAFLTRLTKDKRLIKSVLTYIENRHQPDTLYRQHDDRAILRLACDVRIDVLAAVARADHGGEETKSIRWLTARATDLGVLNRR